eukprot:scaffold19472_cov37-Tisochrysis_lutea.AAC.2
MSMSHSSSSPSSPELPPPPLNLGHPPELDSAFLRKASWSASRRSGGVTRRYSPEGAAANSTIGGTAVLLFARRSTSAAWMCPLLAAISSGAEGYSAHLESGRRPRGEPGGGASYYHRGDSEQWRLGWQAPRWLVARAHSEQGAQRATP